MKNKFIDIGNNKKISMLPPKNKSEGIDSNADLLMQVSQIRAKEIINLDEKIKRNKIIVSSIFILFTIIVGYFLIIKK